MKSADNTFDKHRVQDIAILRHADAVESEIAHLMTDPILSGLIARAIVWRRQRIAELMLQSDKFYLYSRLLQTGQTQILPLRLQVEMMHRLMRMRAAQSPKA